MKRLSRTYEYTYRYIKDNSHCTLLTTQEEYEKMTSRDKLKLSCSCGNIFFKTFDQVKAGQKQCKECGYEIRKLKLSKSHSEFVLQLKEINPNIQIMDKYINNATKIKVMCLIHDEIFYNTPAQLLKGIGCNKCVSETRTSSQLKSHDEFIADMKNINPNIIVLGDYMGCKHKIKCRCLIDNYEWSPAANDLLRGHGCPKCANNLLKTHEQFLGELFEVNSKVKILEQYNGAANKILCECLNDGHKWRSKPSDLLNGYGCPQCNQSKGEKMIDNILSKNEISFIQQYKFIDCRYKKPLPFDFAVFEDNEKTRLKCLIEYDGEHHYKPARYSKDKDKMINRLKEVIKRDDVKNKYCLDKNINLIRIPYWDFDNIEKILREALESNK